MAKMRIRQIQPVLGATVLAALLGACGAGQPVVVSQGAGRSGTSTTTSTVTTAAPTAAGLPSPTSGPPTTSTARPDVRPKTTTTMRSSASSTTPAGWRWVSYHGVEVQTPASWPILDGNQTGFCAGPFPADPTVFLGPQRNYAPHCVPRRPGEGQPSGVDGVWLQPGEPPSDAQPVTTSSGQTVLWQPRRWQTKPINYYWYHGVEIVLGTGPDPALARRMLDSVRYRPGTSDTPAGQACGLNPQPEVMPTPERLTERMVLNQGDMTLDPPTPSDRPTMQPEQAWHPADRPGISHSPLSTYRMILARYTGRLPATLNPDGSTTPVNQNVLAWVVYSAPVTPAVPNCGAWGADVFDAHSGQELIGSAWAPGP